ncbi:hypothetical protein ACIBSR_26230 [Streptomyces sp. NPDC049936]|uniref:hypothetical protein n=1 Tax=Streptomyces sp. NPDC049936 TaxID=3365599 RepID=UPI00379F6E86
MAGELVFELAGVDPMGDMALAACSPTVGHDARLTLQTSTRRTASRRMVSDLGFSMTISGRHLFDDASCGVRGDP